MTKKILYVIVLILALVCVLASCGDDEPTISVNSDGYVVVNGVVTEHLVNKDDVITVNEDGFVVVNGVTTEIVADKADVITVDNDGYLVVNGVKTEHKIHKEVIDENPQGLLFTLKDDNTYAVEIGAAKYQSKIEIPATYKGKTVSEVSYFGYGDGYEIFNDILEEIIISEGVTAIKPSAFSYCKNLKRVVLPNTIKNIGANAFSECEKLSDIILPNGIESINERAFEECSSLTTINIPKSVTYIGEEAFYYCSALTIYCEEISKPDAWDDEWDMPYKEPSLPYIFPTVWDCNNNDIATDGYVYTVIDGIRYGIKDGEAAIAVQRKNIGSFSIPNDICYDNEIYLVTSILDNSLEGNDNIENITIGENIRTIGSGAFQYCKNLVTITISESVTYIGGSAFSGCTALEKIYFNAIAVDDLPSGAFRSAGSNGDGITLVIGKNVTKIPAGIFGYYDSRYTPNFISIEFEQGSVCHSIGYDAFHNCNILNIYYPGTELEWAEISIDSCNDSLATATIHYNYIPEE